MHTSWSDVTSFPLWRRLHVALCQPLGPRCREIDIWLSSSPTPCNLKGKGGGAGRREGREGEGGGGKRKVEEGEAISWSDKMAVGGSCEGEV